MLGRREGRDRRPLVLTETKTPMVRPKTDNPIQPVVLKFVTVFEGPFSWSWLTKLLLEPSLELTTIIKRDLNQSKFETQSREA